MKYMITWTLPHGTYKEAVGRFMATGAPLPDGIKDLGRWHAVDESIGFHLVETDNGGALMQHAAAWKDVLEISIVPVVDDAEAGAAMSKVFGK